MIFIILTCGFLKDIGLAEIQNEREKLYRSLLNYIDKSENNKNVNLEQIEIKEIVDDVLKELSNSNRNN